MPRGLWPVPVLLVLVLLTGCGGGGTDTVTQVRTQTSAEPLTKAEYIAQSDAICQRYRERGNELSSQAKDLAGQENAHKAADILSQASDLVTAEVQELQALQPPARDAQVLREMLSSISSSASHEGDLANAINDLDAEGVRRTQALVAEDVLKARGIAQGYGLKVCGQGGG